MAMGWLKGLVAPAAFGDPAGMGPAAQQPMMPGMQPPQGGPPVGGMMPQGSSPYGVGQPMSGPPAIGAPGGPPPYEGSALPGAMQWSSGTRTQGAAAGGGVSGGGAAATSLEARCAQLQNDVDSLALFARTLLTMLEDAKVVTRAQFDATKNRLDMLDGKLDDR
jgi:hypothetical protein